jgi:protein-disulfide isomerase
MPQRKAQNKRKLSPFYWLLGGIAILGVAAIAWVASRGSSAASEPIEVPAAATGDANALVAAARGIKYGPDSARVRLLVFSDYQCPACQHFASNGEKSLRSEYINSGKVQMIYYDFPLTEIHKWAFMAARAGRCAEDQGKFTEYHDQLFANQSDWSFEQSAPTGRFEGYAKDVGLDVAKFKTCLNSDRHADLVSANRALGTSLGVRGTPALFMNGKYLTEEWRDFTDLRARIEAELGS